MKVEYKTGLFNYVTPILEAFSEIKIKVETQHLLHVINKTRLVFNILIFF